jgi:beta-phosphoglucomutase-like phosphatase (HAD superfamily)
VEQGLEGLRPPRSPDDALSFQGAIFDVDGTLVDSNAAHAQAFVEAFSEGSFDVPFDKVRRLIAVHRAALRRMGRRAPATRARRLRGSGRPT